MKLSMTQGVCQVESVLFMYHTIKNHDASVGSVGKMYPQKTSQGKKNERNFRQRSHTIDVCVQNVYVTRTNK